MMMGSMDGRVAAGAFEDRLDRDDEEEVNVSLTATIGLTGG
jgi:hypothetical protein